MNENTKRLLRKTAHVIGRIITAPIWVWFEGAQALLRGASRAWDSGRRDNDL